MALARRSAFGCGVKTEKNQSTREKAKPTQAGALEQAEASAQAVAPQRPFGAETAGEANEAG